MPVRSARERNLRCGLRLGRCLGIAALFLVIGNRALQTAIAEGDTRTISFHHVHTNEDLIVTYKRNGRYDEAALKKLNWLMRDWRRDQETTMDPHLFDLLWETYREVGGKEPIQIICGYRSSETNSMLRARSSGVAQFSLHTKGDAIDFYIPGVPLELVRNIGLRMQHGGVGFYPTSGSPFVHLDTGSIRHWPRMSYAQLSKVFPDGRTVHVPSDGHPLPGYALALAEVERQGQTPSTVSLAAARDGSINEADQRVAERIVTAPKRSLIAGLLNLPGAEREKTAPPPPAPIAVASLSPPAQVTTTRIVPLPKGRPAEPVAVAALTPVPAPRPVILASIAPLPLERPQLPHEITQQVASADPETTASAAQALAFAGDTLKPAVVTRAKPMGAGIPARAPTLAAQGVPAPAAALAAAAPGITLSDPWLRMAMLTPSVSHYLTATRTGRTDMRQLREFVRKPASSVVMTFAQDPHDGMRTDRFSGHAVVFLATATFGSLRTASLAK